MPLAILDFAFQMSPLAVWFWILVLIGLVWLRRHLDINRGARDRVLSRRDALGSEPLPPLSVLVAAKDEEDNIERCLTGLLAQDYDNVEFLAMNDRSTDRTAMILDRMAADDQRLSAIHVDHLPPDWTGKCHAMHTGVARSTGDYLCLTDADCQFPAPELLAAAVRFAQQEKVDFLSVLPDLEAHTFWEKVVQPPAGAVLVFWFPPDKVNNPASSRAYANGAFILISRSAYERIGGHKAVCGALNEDMRMATNAKRAGLRLRVIRSDAMYSVRMYVGLRQIWAGWTRIFYGCFGSWPRLIVSSIFLSVFSLAPWLSLAAAAFLDEAGAGIALAAAWAVIAQQSVLARFYKLCRTPPAQALTYPLGAGLCLAMIINAMTRLAGRKTTWRGTTYAADG